MPTFDTPNPIEATITVVAGDVRISASERTTTSVTVQPTDPSNDEDRKAAELTRVECPGGRLIVSTPKLRSWLPRSSGGSVDVRVELPAGSEIHGGGALADFTCDGPLGGCRLKTGLGHIRVDVAESVTLKTGIGDISVERTTGDAELTVGTGEARARELARAP